jgi:acetyl esterase
MGESSDTEIPDLGGADEQLNAWLLVLREDPAPPASELGAEGLRDISRERSGEAPPGPEVHRVEDLTVPCDPPLPTRLYRPDPEPRPLLVFLHGGGFVFGDLASHDAMCRRLCLTARVGVLAVDYRRAPEHPWPAAVDDAVAAYLWAEGEQLGDGRAPLLAGDSAGGTLAILACLRLAEQGARTPSGLVLVNPNTDLTLSSESVAEKAEGWGLDARDMRWFASQWVPDGVELDDGRVSPIHTPDLGGLPPTVMATAEHDPLRDEGQAFARRLTESGVHCRHRCEAGLVHGFLTLDCDSQTCREAAERLFADVRELVDHLG